MAAARGAGRLQLVGRLLPGWSHRNPVSGAGGAQLCCRDAGQRSQCLSPHAQHRLPLCLACVATGSAARSTAPSAPCGRKAPWRLRLSTSRGLRLWALPTSDDGGKDCMPTWPPCFLAVIIYSAPPAAPYASSTWAANSFLVRILWKQKKW